MSSFDAQGLNVQQLLGNASNHQIVVPQFQRGYSWEKSHVSTFWDDLKHFRSSANVDQGDNYFLGPVVYVEETPVRILLLDGQQRLLTSTILLSVIRDIARERFGQSGHDLARDIQRDFVYRDHEDPQLAIIPSEVDRDYFQRLIQDDELDRERPVARVRSHRLIRNATNFLKKSVEDELEGKSNAESVFILQALKRALTRALKITAIRVESEEQAYHIFETLNDRGLRLSPADLLLNYLLSRAKDDAERTDIKTNWNKMVDTLGMKQPSSFLRHMWISRYGDVKSTSLYRVIRDHVADERITPIALAEICFTDSERYQRIANLDSQLFQGNTRVAGRGLLKYYSADKVMPLFLSASELPLDYFGKVVLLVERLYVRYVVVANGNPSVLEDYLYSTAKLVRDMFRDGQKPNQIVKAVSAELKKIDPSDDASIAGVRDLVFENGRAAQYFVRSLADKIEGLPSNFDEKAVNLEHIFPENPLIAEWPNHDELNPLTWHLGNLTTLERDKNERAGNRGYWAKRAIFESSAIKMTTDIAKEFEDWSAETVVQRAESLSESVVARWPKL